MLKTTQRKLFLHPETIRRLTDGQLGRVNGGVYDRDTGWDTLGCTASPTMGPECPTRAPPCCCAPSDSMPH